MAIGGREGVVLLALICVFAAVEGTVPSVTSITPREGGLAGATLITVNGNDFSDSFNLDNNPATGTHMWLVDSTDNHVCDLHPDGVTKTTATCYTKAMPEREYSIKVRVNGQDVTDYCKDPSLCTFKAKEENTPKIFSLHPVTGTPGTHLHIEGRLFTQVLETNQVGQSTETKLLRVWLKDKQCQMKRDGSDELYGLALYNDTENNPTDNGYIKCVTNNSYVGLYNVSFIVSGPYGRSSPNHEVKRVFSTGIGMYEMYTEISSVESSKGDKSGSTEGEQQLVIKGQHFDATDRPVKVMVGASPCDNVTLVNSTCITCRTPPQPSTAPPLNTAHRGVDLTIVNGSVDYQTADWNSGTTSRLDSTAYNTTQDSQSPHAIRMLGVYIPPWTMTCQFYLKAASGFLTLTNPTNNSQMVQVTSTSMAEGNGLASDYVDLMYNHEYKLEVQAGVTGVTEVRASARCYNTTYLSSQSGQVIPEIQSININSVVIREKQSIQITRNSGPSLGSTQQIVVTGTLTDSIRVGFYGVFTEPLKVSDTTGQLLATALSKLPSISPYPVSATHTVQATSRTYTITFPAILGKAPAVVVKTGPTCTAAVSITQEGTTTADNYRLAWGNGVTSVLNSTSTADDIKTALKESIGIRCHEYLTQGRELLNCEPNGRCPKARVTDEEPFCGTGSVKDPGTLYWAWNQATAKTLMGLNHNTLCLAHKGPVASIWFRFRFEKGSEAGNVHVNLPVEVPSDKLLEWRYTCRDVYNIAKDLRKDKQKYYLFAVGMNRNMSVEVASYHVYVDQIVMNAGHTFDIETVALDMRMPQMRPNNGFIKTLSVTENNGVHSITFTPHRCANSFPLLAVAEAQPTSGGTGVSSNSAVFGPGGDTVQVTRVTSASSPVRGKFSVTMNGVTTQDIRVTEDLTEQSVSYTLSQNSELGNVEVAFSGDCANFNYIVTIPEKPGDLREMIVNGADLTGNEVTYGLTTQQNGSVWFAPITGNMLRQIYSTPQVSVTINGIASSCEDGVDCSYSWQTNRTPTISSISPTSGGQGTQVTITGTNFLDTDINDYNVTMGGSTCTVTAVTTTTIQCTASVGPAEAQPVVVVVEQLGLASGSVDFTYTSVISSIAPTSGSFKGGIVLSVTGQGFAQGSVVTVGGQPCVVLSATVVDIECRVPAYTLSSATDVAAPVVVTSNGETLTSSTSFTYSVAKTPTITAISTNQAPAWGGTTVTVTGTGFGSETPAVSVNGIALQVTDNSDTQIQAQFPPLTPGSSPLMVMVENKGYADPTTTDVTIAVTLQVTSMTPNLGSLMGGTLVSLGGQGFGSVSSRVSVTLGQTACDVESVTDTLIKCRVADTTVVHEVSNSGVHKDYGLGYDWEPRLLQAQTGDTVRWTFSTPSFVEGILYGVHQTDSDNANSNMPGGFTSGANRKNGQFEFRVTTPGYYFYWSKPVNEPYETIILRGTVKVDQKPSSLEKVVVTVGGSEADYILPSSSTPSSSCSYPIAGCTPATLTAPDATHFYFKLDACATPNVTVIGPRSVTALDVVTISGSGLGSGSGCINEISYADVPQTDILNETSTEVNLKLNAGEPPVSVSEEFSVRVGDFGNAVIGIAKDSERRVALLSTITDVSPESGSLAGSTMLTIQGFGLSAVQVTLDGAECEIQSQTYTHITCTTPPSPVAQQVTVMVTLSGQSITCPGTTCDFTYSTSHTPQITAVTPQTLTSSPTTLIFTGTMLGTVMADVSVSVGEAQCVVSDVTDVQLVCSVSDVPAGSYDPKVTNTLGRAKTQASHAITSSALVSMVSPSEGSVHGGTSVTLTGHGFSSITTVTINDKTCAISSTTSSTIVCTTPANAAGSSTVKTTSGNLEFPEKTFTYSSSITPVVSSVSPDSGEAGDTVVITGSGFSTVAADNVVRVGDAGATVSLASATSLTIVLGSQLTGSFPVVVNVDGVGLSNDDVEFEYTLSLQGFTPTTGTTGGGQELQITGSGFLPGDTVVKICNLDCVPVQSSITASQLTCITPPNPVAALTACDIVVTVNGISKTATGQYSFDPAITPQITAVSPLTGSSAGGTTLTITGTGFGTDKTKVSVTLGSSVCDVQTTIDTEITCVTNSATSDYYNVSVNVDNNGLATAAEDTGVFRYVNMWSSRYTWGNNDPPVAGDFVVIPRGNTIVLDTDTPVLAMLLIQGTLMFARDRDVELQATKILVTDGGALQVGTRDNPFPEQYTAIITLHGNRMEREIPTYGNKVLALRNGTIDLHGHPVLVTWTKLAATAPAGAQVITLTTPVIWKAGDKIVLPTTSHRHSQVESETNIITDVSGDGLSLTLRDPLTYEHVVVQHTFDDGQEVTLRGEVGLLSHNVVVRGAIDQNWLVNITACPEGFNTGEFATQTCFQGRFGDETGSDEYGGHVIMHSPTRDEQDAILRVSYVEFYYMGQAFRLGRYPLHLHMNGNISLSYIVGASVHWSFNRAVNIHGSHNLLVEHLVAYNIMGGAIFLEDGVETNNTLQYILIVFCKHSSSLKNDDITPAGFWVTNALNYILHNAVAGGSHFGFWYRALEHPEGPSFDATICPKKAPMGAFFNNSAHSQGWFGLWIFEEMFPHEGSGLCSSTVQKVAVFRQLTAWNCEKGAEAVIFGRVQFVEFMLVNNQVAGFEGKKVKAQSSYDETNGAKFADSVIVAHLGDKLDMEKKGVCTKAGLVLPYGQGFMVVGVTFYNFNASNCVAFAVARITGTCSKKCGGYQVFVKGLAFQNTPKLTRFAWAGETVLRDVDGSLTGTAGSSVVPYTPDLPPSCVNNTSEFQGSGSMVGSVCPQDVRFHRFAFNSPEPSTLMFKKALMTNQYGTTFSSFTEKRLTHTNGWMILLQDNECYRLEFESVTQITNFSFVGQFYDFQDNDILCIEIEMDRPDRLSFDGGENFVNESTTALTLQNAEHMNWNYVEDQGLLRYYIKRSAPQQLRRKRSVTTTYNIGLSFKAFKCWFPDCQPPPDPLKLASAPNTSLPWSQNSTWDFRSGGMPQEGDNVTIPEGIWILIDIPIPPLDTLIVEGALSAAPDSSLVFTLSVNNMIVAGRFAIGFEVQPFPGQATIHFRGTRSSPSLILEEQQWPPKSIGVLGLLDFHGLEPNYAWTDLAETVSGGTTIQVVDAVDWTVGNDIIITTTDLSPRHTEVFQITAITNRTLTLNDTIQYRHIAHEETISGDLKVNLRSRVALLTRNIKIHGGGYPAVIPESFGGTILIKRGFHNGTSRNGAARVSNTEFYHMGQEGFRTAVDSRYPLSFQDVFNDDDFPSYVRNNAFHHIFSPAVGVFAVDNLEVSSNVIYNAVYSAIHTTSTGTRILNNLMALTIWTGAYLGRVEPFNIEYAGAVEAIAATDIELRGNIVAGSERVGYHLQGQACTTATEDLWADNEAHSCLIGVNLFPTDKVVSTECAKWSGFYVWKNVDFGIYLNTRADLVRVSDCVSVENSVGCFLSVIEPSATFHAFRDKKMEIERGLFVSRTSSFDCALDRMNTSDPNIKGSVQGRSWTKGNDPCGKGGISFPTFSGNGNQAPEMDLRDSMSYQSIMGKLDIKGVTFAKFGQNGGETTDYCVTTNPANEDLQHPVEVSGVTLHDVRHENVIYYTPQTTSKIDPSNCVDMPCDAKKKFLFVDKDGSMLGHRGTVLPNAGQMWDEPGFGTGNYRIPKAMLTGADGSPLDADTIAPYKGIYNYENCTFRNNWNGFECDDSVDYAILHMESMDSDTETRRISPIAVFSGGYVDLLNGPQDHGWCAGYTCLKRLSLFPALVPLSRWVHIYTSGTVPNKMRFMLLNVAANECVGLVLYKSSTHRLDFNYDGNYVMPLNGEMKNGSFFLKRETTPGEFFPNLETGSMGDHYVQHSSNRVYWLQCGPEPLTFAIADVVVVSFGLPAMTEEEFFGEQIINNLAQFLSIPPNKVRIVDIVREDSGKRRRKRQTSSTIAFFVEISSMPTEPPGTVDLARVTDQIVTQTHVYGMDSVIGGTIISTSILEPGADSDTSFVAVRRVGTLVLTMNPGGATENRPFTIQPLLQCQSPDGQIVDFLGTASTPWEVEVSILSGGSNSATLTGTKRVTFVNGSATFSDLTIDLPADDYVLRFQVVAPVDASNYTLDTLPFTVAKRPVALLGVIMTHNPLVNAPVHVSFRLVDVLSNQHISDIAWRGHTWTITSTFVHQQIYSGQFHANTSAVTFDPATANADFPDLQLTLPGVCPVTFTVTSDPPEYEITGQVEVAVMSQLQRDLPVEKTSTVELRLALAYDPVVAKFFAMLVRNYYGQKIGIRIIGHTTRAGSIVVTLTVEGTNKGLNDLLTDICDDIHKETTFTYDGVTVTMTSDMMVDGSLYYGVSCYEEDKGLHPGVIAAIVLACVIVVAIIVLVLLWKFYVYPKTKTYDTDKNHAKHMGAYRQDTIEDILFRENTFTSLKSKSTPTPLPPVTTAMDPNSILWRTNSELLPPMPGTPEPPRSVTPRTITPRPLKMDF